MVMPLPPAPPGMQPPGSGGVPEFPPLQFLSRDRLQPPGGEFIQQAEPKQPRRKKPDRATIQQRATRIENFWLERNNRMDEDQALYAMVEARRKQDGDGEKVVRNTIYTLVEKAANMIGAQSPVIQHEPARLDQREVSQRVENLLRWLWSQWNHEWMQNLHTPLRRDAAHFLVLRGWLAARVWFDPDHAPDEAPVKLMLADPRYVYPARGSNGKIRYVVHRYTSTLGEVLDEWPEAEEFYTEEDDEQEVTVTAYYDDWWHAVLIDGHEVKPPQAHGYGFTPWIFAMGNGAPIRSNEHRTPSWTGETGVSLFHSIKYAYRQQNRLLSQLADEVARAANPPTVYYYDPDNEEPARLDLEPGATNYFLNNEKAEFMETSPNPNNVAPLLQALEDDVQKGGLPPVLWGGGGADTSGFAISLLSGAARDALFGVISALEFGMELINRYALTLIRDFEADPVGVVVRDKNGNYLGGETVDPHEIAEVGVNNRVKFRDVAPQDRFQMMQAAIALTDKNLVSMEYARDELIGVDNPEEENQRVLNEMIYRDEDILKDVLNPLSLYQHSPALFDVWLAMQRFRRFEEERKQAEQQQAGPPGTPPLPGTPPMPGGVPAPMGPLPFDPAAQASGSALGGAGVQRVPGMPGIGGLIPGGNGV